MNDAHLHLVFNHFPIIIPIIGTLILISGFLFKSEVIKRTALGVFVLGSLFIFPSMFTGEGAEEVVEQLSVIDKNMIHEHEEMAEKFAIVTHILGFISLIGLWASWKQKSFAKYFFIIPIFMVIIVIYLGKLTGTSGGEIRHTEIRSSTAIQNSAEYEDD
jgi:uncharacterized membrane protein